MPKQMATKISILFTLNNPLYLCPFRNIKGGDGTEVWKTGSVPALDHLGCYNETPQTG